MDKKELIKGYEEIFEKSKEALVKVLDDYDTDYENFSKIKEIFFVSGKFLLDNLPQKTFKQRKK